MQRYNIQFNAAHEYKTNTIVTSGWVPVFIACCSAGRPKESQPIGCKTCGRNVGGRVCSGCAVGGCAVGEACVAGHGGLLRMLLLQQLPLPLPLLLLRMLLLLPLSLLLPLLLLLLHCGGGGRLTS